MQNNKIKICHVANSSSAVKSLLLPQLKFLTKEGYDVSVACAEGKWSEEIKREGIKIKNISFSRNMFSVLHFVAFLQMFFYFKKEKFDIVHTHNPVPGFLGQTSAKLAGIKTIVNTVHGFYFSEDTPYLKRKIFIFAEKIAAKCSTLILSQSAEDMQTAVKEKICAPEKIKYLGNGVDMEKFNPKRFTEKFIKQKKKELNIKNDIKILGTVGRIVEEKGYLELFEAFKSILAEFPETMLLIVGPADTSKKDSINYDDIEKYGIENNVKVFWEERTDTDELYSLMDIFVFASHREGFPRSVIEAMAMAKPIVATNIRGCREAIENGKSGILVPSKSPEKLAEAFKLLLKDKNKADSLAIVARNRAEKEFDERLVFGRIKECYQILTNQE